MAKLLQGLLGGIKGKIGNMVGSSWKGIPVIKTKALSVANPRTAGQVSQRSKMSGIVAVASLLLSTIIKPLWDRFASKMSGYNAFVAANIACFTDGVLTDFANFIISSGKMAITELTPSITHAAQKNVDIVWNDDSGTGYFLSTDLFYGVAYCPELEEYAVLSGAANRALMADTFSFESNLVAGYHVYIYGAFKRADGTVVSNTSYNAITIVA